MMGAEQERNRSGTSNSPDHDDRHWRVGDRKARNGTHARRTERAAPGLEPRPGTFRTDHEGCIVSDVPTLQNNAAAVASQVNAGETAHSLVGTAQSS